MKTPSRILDAQLSHLLQVVDEYRQARCRAVIEEAQAQTATLVRQAHRNARERMHETIVDLQARMRGRIASTEAQLQTRARQRRQRAQEQLLRAAWRGLEQSLERRWAAPATRRQWVDKLVHEARTALTRCTWELEYPQDWAPEELANLVQAIQDHTRQPPECTANGDIGAGLRIHAAGACLDGTIGGLLANRSRTEAALLGEIERRNAGRAPPDDAAPRRSEAADE